MKVEQNQFSLLYLFYATTYVGVGSWLVSMISTLPFLGLSGVGILVFWASNAVFAFTKQTMPVVGLPLIFLAMIGMGISAPCILIGILMHLFTMA